MSDEMREGQLKNKAEQKAEVFFKKYRKQMQAMEHSPLSRARTLTAYDYYALGSQLDAWENYVAICEDDGTVNALGKLPNIALDVITVTYGSSPLSVMAATQPIEEEVGTVYYKQLVAASSRGSHNAGDIIINPTEGQMVPLSGFSSDTVTETAGTTADGTLSYAGNLTNVPLRKEKVVVMVNVNGTTLTAKDNGQGYLIGYNLQGTINYATGAFVVEFKNNPGGAYPIVFQTATNFEGSTDIPKIAFRLTSKQVTARVWALKDTIGLEQSYALRKRFNMTAEDEMAKDLVASINSELATDAIRRLAMAAIDNVNYTKAAPTAVSDYEHRMSFKFRLADAESNLLKNAGRGSVNVMIAGLNVSSIISTLPGFVKITEGSDVGPHIYGTLDNVIVIRVQNTSILSPDKLITMYKGSSPFEGPLVWAPYMPLVTTAAMPNGTNPLMTQKAAAVWGGLDLLVPNFVTQLTLI